MSISPDRIAAINAIPEEDIDLSDIPEQFRSKDMENTNDLGLTPEDAKLIGERAEVIAEWIFENVIGWKPDEDGELATSSRDIGLTALATFGAFKYLEKVAVETSEGD